jgi:hypothetical protein
MQFFDSRSVAEQDDAPYEKNPSQPEINFETPPSNRGNSNTPSKGGNKEILEDNIPFFPMTTFCSGESETGNYEKIQCIDHQIAASRKKRHFNILN